MGRRAEIARRDFVVARPRLIRALEDAPGRVVVLRAPAGFGKTTLARQWVSTVQASTWYRATAASRDVAALAVGLFETMSAVQKDPPRRFAPKSADPARLADLLLESNADWPSDGWLVIDDYQWIAGSEASELLLDRLVEHERVNLLVASRTRPAWATARRLLYGRVLELTQSALAMTTQEVHEVFKKSGLEDRDIAANAHGWPAVIGLAARATSRETPSALAEPLPEELHRFFAEELFHHLPESVREDLTALAIAPRLDEDLLAEVLSSRLDEFLGASMDAGFLTPVGGELEIHPLLREFLGTKLPSASNERLTALGDQLTAHYLRVRQFDEAFAIAERLQSARLLILAFEAGLEDLLASGRLATLERWITVARDNGVDSPVLDLAEAEIDLRAGRFQRASARAHDVANAVGRKHRIHARAWFLAGHSAHIDNRLEDAVRYLKLSSEASTNPRDRFRALWSTFFVQMEREAVAEAERTLRELEGGRGFEAEDKLRLEQARLVFAIRTGGLEEQLACAEAVRTSMPVGVDPVIVTAFLHTVAHAYNLSACYDEAAEASAYVLSYGAKSGLDFVLPHALCERATAKLGKRRFVEALADVERAFDHATAVGDVHSEMNSLSIAAKTYLCKHEPERAISVLSGLWERPANPGMAGDYYAIQGLAFACSGDWSNAEAAVRRSEEASTLSQGRVLSRFVTAVIAAGTGNRTTTRLLERAIFEATRSGNLDAFVVAYRAFPDILTHLRLTTPASASAVRALGRLDPRLAERAGLTRPRPRARAHKKLTNREAEILGLIRQGLSNRQIATTLWLSEATVKLHVHHILEKLGAKSRTEAAALGDG